MTIQHGNQPGAVQLIVIKALDGHVVFLRLPAITGRSMFAALRGSVRSVYHPAWNEWTIPPMQADFHDAHDRHWYDAERLYGDARWANADHLYGLAAECGLKRLMHEFGMALDKNGDPASPNDRKHADRLWVRYDAYRMGYLNGTAYPLPTANPFEDWSVEQRYANQNAFEATRVAAHRLGADVVSQLVRKARTNGLIP